MKQQNYNVRTPQLVSLETALEVYYSRPELSNADIKQLFGEKLSSATVSRLKAKVREQMVAENIPVWNSRCINTETAFKVWGLDVTNLENRLKKLRELKGIA